MPKFGALDNQKIGQHTKDDFRKVLESQGFLCFYCGIPIVQGSRDPECEATEDHLVPQSRGGVDFIWNIVAACLACNKLKGSMLPGQFLQHRWSLAQLVDPQAHKSTRIPFSKGRVLPYQDDEFDDDGNLIIDHVEVAPLVGSMVRALACATKMEESETARRKNLLRSQVNGILRHRLEDAGQMLLQFDKSKLIADALESTEQQALLVRKGMMIVEQFRRLGIQQDQHGNLIERQQA